MDLDKMIEYIKKNTAFNPVSVRLIGKGASACVYKLETDKEPYVYAVKYSTDYELLMQEYEQIKFISDRVDCKMPELYHLGQLDNGSAVMIMEFFDGISADKIKSIRKASKILPDMVVDNLIKIHTVHNDKFGPVDNAVYDTWYDYYSEFASEIYNFAKESYSRGVMRKKAFKAVELSYENLDKILKENSGEPTLIHGDYWQPNFVVNPKTYELIGVIDPFNIMWAEPEYELFALTVGGSARLKLYENYKSKVSTSAYCDLKVEMYALYNELLWYQKLNKFDNGYLLYRGKRLIKQMNKKGLV